MDKLLAILDIELGIAPIVKMRIKLSSMYDLDDSA